MADIEDLVKQLRTYLDVAEEEVKHLKNGRKSSAPRARKSLQQLKTGSHSLRAEIIKYVKALPVKSRVTKSQVEEPVPDLVKSLDTDDDEVPTEPPKLERQAADEVKEEAVEKPVKKARAKKAVKKVSKD